MDKTKVTLFFVLIFLLTTLSTLLSGVTYLSQQDTIPDMKGTPIIIIILYALLITVILGSVYYFCNRNETDKEAFRFEVTPEKLCQGWPNLQPDSPQARKYCEQLMSTEQGYDQFLKYNCVGAYTGRPLNMEKRTDESNQFWDNNMGRDPILSDNPKVL